MNRNTEAYFSELPRVEVGRSIFDRSHEHLLSGNVGDLIPIYWDEVLPGDTFQMRTSCVIRLQTLLSPVFSNLYADIYYFFVPMRLTWDSTKEFYGENTGSAWIPQSEKTMPIIKPPVNGWDIGTIADYMGVPPGLGQYLSDNVTPRSDSDFPISLPFRAYALIANEWFRNQNLSDPLNIPLGDSTQTGSNGDNYITDVANGGKPFKVARYADYFSSCLPSPQKGPAVEINLGEQLSAPVSTEPYDFSKPYPGISGGYDPLALSPIGGGTVYKLARTSEQSSNALLGNNTEANIPVFPVNLYAKLDNIGVTSINELRLAFQLQKFYEKNARGGTRMREVIHEHFGVTSPDARMQIPEYLGGHRFPVQIHQVTNNSQGESSFLGDLGAMSNTADVHDDFIKSFTEPGYIIGVMALRYDTIYSQGLEKAWSRRRLIDHYFPVFAHIGEQPVYTREIYAAGDGGSDVFGYNSAWSEYRFKPSRCSAEMRPGHDMTLDSWHFADYYESVPYLSDEWIRMDKTNVDRALAVTSSVSNQFFGDFYFECKATRPMPLHSIPGLVDHF